MAGRSPGRAPDFATVPPAMAARSSSSIAAAATRAGSSAHARLPCTRSSDAIAPPPTTADAGTRYGRAIRAWRCSCRAAGSRTTPIRRSTCSSSDWSLPCPAAFPDHPRSRRSGPVADVSTLLTAIAQGAIDSLSSRDLDGDDRQDDAEQEGAAEDPQGVALHPAVRERGWARWGTRVGVTRGRALATAMRSCYHQRMAATAGPALLDEEGAAFVQGGVSIVAASRDAALVPSIGRVVGCRVAADRRRVTVFVAASSRRNWSPTCAHAAASP